MTTIPRVVYCGGNPPSNNNSIVTVLHQSLVHNNTTIILHKYVKQAKIRSVQRYRSGVPITVLETRPRIWGTDYRPCLRDKTKERGDQHPFFYLIQNHLCFICILQLLTKYPGLDPWLIHHWNHIILVFYILCLTNETTVTFCTSMGSAESCSMSILEVWQYIKVGRLFGIGSESPCTHLSTCVLFRYNTC